MAMLLNYKSGILLAKKDLEPLLEPIIKVRMLSLLSMILPKKTVLKMWNNSGWDK